MPLHTDRTAGDGDRFAHAAQGRREDWGQALAYRLVCLGQALKGVLGAPDYQAYLAHHQTVHPDVPPMSEAAFFRVTMDRRCSKPGSGMRCC